MSGYAGGYNLNHVQIAALEAGDDPSWVDLRGVQSWEPSISTDSEDVQGDGGILFTAYGAPVGEGDLQFALSNFSIFAILNGGEVSSHGTGSSEVERYEQPGHYVAPPFAAANWVPNVAQGVDPSVAGMRTIVPNATAEPVSQSLGQETVVEWTASMRFTPDDNNVLIIYEMLSSEPDFDSDDVMDVDLERPENGGGGGGD